MTLTQLMSWSLGEHLRGLMDPSVPKDRFGRPRGGAYRQEDFQLCKRCIDPSKPLKDQTPDPKCSLCGGYGEH